jgi:flagellin-specific chaperone FliS
MSYKKITFKKALEDINSRKMLLPAIQRRFVWDTDQIEVLFDSIMRDYPIGSFLFWEVKPEAFQNYAFYEFMKDYHQRDNQFNKLAPKSFKPESPIIGVLDGQQRLSSIYIGLVGTYAYKLPYYGWNNDKAFPKRFLYINLLHKQNTDEHSPLYKFEFLTEDESNICLKDEYWFKVSEIIKWQGAEDNDDWFDVAIKELNDAEVNGSFPRDIIQALESSKKEIKRTLAKLYNKLHNEEILNYFEVQGDDIDAVLEIFARVNSGGKSLSKSDLLFSTIVAHWNEGRDMMEDLLKEINEDNFNFDADFIVRACQMLVLDIPMKLEIKNFTAKNVSNVENKWDEIKTALLTTVSWLKEFGYSRDTLTSQNAVLPIAFFIFYKGSDKKKDEWRQYLTHALIKNVFSSQNDRLLEELRTELKSNIQNFQFKNWIVKKFASNKSFAITEEDIEELLTYKKGRHAYIILSYLYSYKFNQLSIHLDHIHPASGFTTNKLNKLNINDDSISKWQNIKDQLPNLQMLDSTTNISKNDKALNEWIEKEFPTDDAKARFFLSNYYPQNPDLEFKKFEEFFESRKNMLRDKLRQKFNVGSVNVSMIQENTLDDSNISYL